MRMAQYYGLNKSAKKLVLKKVMVREIGTTILPDGKRVNFDRRRPIPAAKKQVIGDIKTMNPQLALAQLHRFTMPDGRVFEEFVQAAPWSGGPCYFIALKFGSGPNIGKPVAESLWTDEEMSQY